MSLKLVASSALVALLGIATTIASDLPVDINRVDFRNSVRPFNWNLVAVEVEAFRNPDPEASNPRYVDDIIITVTLGYENQNGDGFTFYQTEANLVTLETRKSKEIGFWMPYAVVERDNLPKEPKFWLVELEVAGQKLDLLSNDKSFSSSFTSRQSIEGFLRQASSGLSETEGIFVPYYLSPNPPLDTREPPAFVRKEPS